MVAFRKRKAGRSKYFFEGDYEFVQAILTKEACGKGDKWAILKFGAERASFKRFCRFSLAKSMHFWVFL